MELALAYFSVHSNVFHEAREHGKLLFDPFAGMREDELKESGLEVPFASAKDLFVARRVAESNVSKAKAAEDWKNEDHEPWIKRHHDMKDAFSKAERKWMADKVKEAAKLGASEAKALQKELKKKREKEGEDKEKEEQEEQRPKAKKVADSGKEKAKELEKQKAKDAAEKKKKADEDAKKKEAEQQKAAKEKEDAEKKKKEEAQKKKEDAEKKKKKKDDAKKSKTAEADPKKRDAEPNESTSAKKKVKKKKNVSAGLIFDVWQAKVTVEEASVSELPSKKTHDEGSVASQGIC